MIVILANLENSIDQQKISMWIIFDIWIAELYNKAEFFIFNLQFIL